MRLFLILGLTVHLVKAKALAEAEADPVADAEADPEADASSQVNQMGGPGMMMQRPASFAPNQGLRKYYTSDVGLGTYGSLNNMVGESTHVMPLEGGSQGWQSVPQSDYYQSSWVSQPYQFNTQQYQSYSQPPQQEYEYQSYTPYQAQMTADSTYSSQGESYSQDASSDGSGYVSVSTGDIQANQDTGYMSAGQTAAVNTMWPSQPMLPTYNQQAPSFNAYNQMYTRSYTNIPGTNCMNVCRYRRPAYRPTRPSCNVGCNSQPRCSLNRPMVDYQWQGNTLNCQPKPVPLMQYPVNNYNPVYQAGNAQTLPAPVAKSQPFVALSLYSGPGQNNRMRCIGSGCGIRNGPLIQAGGAQTLPMAVSRGDRPDALALTKPAPQDEPEVAVDPKDRT